MANSSVFLADLKARSCTSTAQVSLLRFWEDRNVKRDGEGQHSPHGRQGIFSLLVKCTLLAALSCPDFKLSDSPVSIRLNIETGLKDLTDPGSNSSRTFQEHGLTESFLRACPIGMPDGSGGGGGGLREETAENESCLADVEVKLLEFDVMIKKLSRRRPGQLIKTIAFLEDLHLYILHTYMTTVEQTVLYSFNVKASFTFVHYTLRRSYIYNLQGKVDVEGFLSAQAAIDAIKGSMDLYAANIKAGLQR
ncbi:hypothetical protein HID58_047377 [Brassica napus]|uniref:Gamma-tubulin complex component n=1 Tax=Brassica napus TaxID=3708 RepID=A0ABQ8AZ97_BRANA|nr:hypothetical protein HID58_047377 [Brassica napus]